MKLQVFHRTHYAYASPVRESFNEARLQPTNADGQICHSFTLTVDPATQLNHYLDFQFNWVHLFDVNEPHSALTVEATSVVTTTAEQVLPGDQPSTPLAEMDRSCGRLERCHDFLQTSRFVEPSPEAWRLGLDISHGLRTPGRWPRRSCSTSTANSPTRPRPPTSTPTCARCCG